MNRFCHLILALALLVWGSCGAQAGITITTNLTLQPFDRQLDGQDIAVSNATFTVNGGHSFNSLQIGNGGRLGYTASGANTLSLTYTATNEPAYLTSSNIIILTQSNVVAGSVILIDTNLVTYSNGVDFVQLDLGNGQTEIYLNTNSAIADGTQVWAAYNWTYTYNAALTLTISNDLSVAAGGAILADGAGYASENGPGHGYFSAGTTLSGSGAGNGGSGASLTNAVGGASYDNWYTPQLPGSGGGHSYAGAGGSGGGLILLNVGGNVNIDGVVSANGQSTTNSRAGGGSGGGIWIQAGAQFTGSGTIQANGGAGATGWGGGGGGGRIALFWQTNLFAGQVTAWGGTGVAIGGAGTISSQLTGGTASLLVDNGGQLGTNSPLTLGRTTDVIVRNGGWLTLQTPAQILNSLFLGTNGKLSIYGGTFMQMVIKGNCVIQSNATINMDALAVNATGSGSFITVNANTITAGGGGHASFGAIGATFNSSTAVGGVSTDTAWTPTQPGGSGGSATGALGGAGGAALSLSVAGTLQMDGAITANGGNGSGTGGGGGAGGSLYLTVSNFVGTGLLSATGGNGVSGFSGGGSGGCIAIYATNSAFAGSYTYRGGAGANYGGAGALTLQVGNHLPDVTLDNGGNPGALTTLNGMAFLRLNLTLKSGTRFTPFSSSLSVSNLVIESNAIFNITNASSMANLNLLNLTVQPGGVMNMDRTGYSLGGNGSGSSSSYGPNYTSGGGAHGGAGGYGANFLLNQGGAGGGSFDSLTAPAFGGGAGGSYQPYALGGSGGGALNLSVANNIQIDGTLTANGGNGGALGGGGGAGGAWRISCKKLTGTGLICANGGNGTAGRGGG
ncbi:MAG TPA: hypothetical protein VF607_02600, partial [Verrucomicrobiae bacterium]